MTLITSGAVAVLMLTANGRIAGERRRLAPRGKTGECCSWSGLDFHELAGLVEHVPDIRFDAVLADLLARMWVGSPS